ncbi:MAG: hypothetical protein OEV66_07165 [Spirochaetia bacterium]|nr:hypothetical protein [Spirochaetia bacterium]
MSVRPLDLQVNINSMLETARDQGMRQANLVDAEKVMGNQIIKESRQSEKQVNKTDKVEFEEPMEDSERHFGTKTEAEMEQEHSEENTHRKPSTDTEIPSIEDSSRKSSHHIDFLV